MGKRKNVKLEDIANATGVSIVTVSNALYGKKGVSENVRNKVIKEAERQGYKVRGNRGLENQKIIRFDIYDLDSSNNNLNDISKIIVKIINARGDEYRLLGAKDLKDFGHNIDTDCNIIIGDFDDESLPKAEVPTVVIGFGGIRTDLDYIIPDCFHGMAQIIQQLVYHGHRRIGYMNTIDNYNVKMDEYMGYLSGLMSNGLPEREYYIFNNMEDYWKIDAAERPTAIVCTGCSEATSVINELGQKGIKVPEDVSVTGFFDQVDQDANITTMSYSKSEIAALSVKLLTDRIIGNRAPMNTYAIQGIFRENSTIGNAPGI